MIRILKSLTIIFLFFLIIQLPSCTVSIGLNPKVPTITTIVGIIGLSGSYGDGGFATNAMLNNPNGVCVDMFGNVYIADSWNRVIRKVNASDGKINTVAGTIGVAGSTGDGGLATSAKLNYPQGVFVDASNNIFISDSLNYTIRKVNASDGKINTVAGTVGVAGSSGDGGLATSATFKNPIGIIVDSPGNIYISDYESHVIRKINLSDGKINTIAGTIGSRGTSGDGGLAISAKLNHPVGIFVDSLGNLFIADSGNSVIRKVNCSDGKINTIAGTMGMFGFGGDGSSAKASYLWGPCGVSVDSFGNIYIADTGNNLIRSVNTVGMINTEVGNLGIGGSTGNGGPALNTCLDVPAGLLVDYNNIYIVDTGNQVIRKVHFPN